MADISITAANVAKGTSSTVQDGTAGEALTAGQCVYLKSSDSLIYKADSDNTSATSAAVGIALHAASTNQPIRYLTSGPITIGGTIVAGEVYCVSNNAGGICPLSDIGVGDYTVILGVGASVTVIQVNINSYCATNGIAHG